ncbi:unnamed protein product [Amoebophrya sp. A25]|nr:unnamed protein product [Amoebophrya sp. A25]|eukprot:GSA25T00009341001.1
MGDSTDSRSGPPVPKNPNNPDGGGAGHSGGNGKRPATSGGGEDADNKNKRRRPSPNMIPIRGLRLDSDENLYGDDGVAEGGREDEDDLPFGFPHEDSEEQEDEAEGGLREVDEDIFGGGQLQHQQVGPHQEVAQVGDISRSVFRQQQVQQEDPFGEDEDVEENDEELRLALEESRRMAEQGLGLQGELQGWQAEKHQLQHHVVAQPQAEAHQQEQEYLQGDYRQNQNHDFRQQQQHGGEQEEEEQEDEEFLRILEESKKTEAEDQARREKQMAEYTKQVNAVQQESHDLEEEERQRGKTAEREQMRNGDTWFDALVALSDQVLLEEGNERLLATCLEDENVRLAAYDFFQLRRNGIKWFQEPCSRYCTEALRRIQEHPLEKMTIEVLTMEKGKFEEGLFEIPGPDAVSVLPPILLPYQTGCAGNGSSSSSTAGIHVAGASSSSSSTGVGMHQGPTTSSSHLPPASAATATGRRQSSSEDDVQVISPGRAAASSPAKEEAPVFDLCDSD